MDTGSRLVASTITDSPGVGSGFASGVMNLQLLSSQARAWGLD